jgi:hypothetical protein
VGDGVGLGVGVGVGWVICEAYPDHQLL